MRRNFGATASEISVVIRWEQSSVRTFGYPVDQKCPIEARSSPLPVIGKIIEERTWARSWSKKARTTLTSLVAITSYTVGVGYTLSCRMKYAAETLSLEPSDCTSRRWITKRLGGWEWETMYSNPERKALSSLSG